ncbi:MAG: hypothetical protein ACLSB9_26620 [Hydrogeniiclostridium mannosilyticum]
MENVVKVVNEIINWLWNRENITLLIAIAGFGMSLYNFFRALWDKRCSFRVDYVSHYCCLSKSGKYAEPMFRFNFVNLSSAPLTVVRMFLLVDGENMNFSSRAASLSDDTPSKGETVQIGEVKSQKLPFRLEGKGALGGYFAAYLPTDMEKTFQSAGKWQLVVQTPQKEIVFSIVADKPGYDIEQYGY